MGEQTVVTILATATIRPVLNIITDFTFYYTEVFFFNLLLTVYLTEDSFVLWSDLYKRLDSLSRK